MSRKEFSRSIKVARLKHATRDGVIYCEGCGEPIKGKFHFDHNNPDGLTGTPTFENCRVLCAAVCHASKTKRDVKIIAKAKRIEAKHLGVFKIAKPIQNRQPQKKTRAAKPSLPPLRLYEMMK